MDKKTKNKPLFEIGRVICSEGIQSLLDAQTKKEYLDRHQRGDWGDMDIEAPGENERGLYFNTDTSYVVSTYSHGPAHDPVLVFTALRTGRTVICGAGDMTQPFVMEYMPEFMDLVGD